MLSTSYFVWPNYVLRVAALYFAATDKYGSEIFSDSGFSSGGEERTIAKNHLWLRTIALKTF